MKKISDQIINSIQKCLVNKDKGHHTPNFKGNEKKYLSRCIDTTFVSYVGEFVDKFEKNISEFTKTKFIVATNSGSSALHLLLNYYGLGKKDEVLVPSFTYIATVNPIYYCGATPNFIDIEKDTLGVCPVKLENYLNRISFKKNGFTYNKKTKKKISALIAVHVHGFPCQIDKINKICKKFNILLIEDAAEAFGSFYKKKHLGTFGSSAILSFNGNKIITTGSGGAVMVKSKKIADTLKHISTHAKMQSQVDSKHDRIGFNYRMSNISAALGCAQLENIQNILKAKRKNYHMYKKIFRKNKKIFLFKEPKGSKTNYWLISIRVENKKLKNLILRKLRQKGYGLRSVWRPIHSLKIYKNCPRDSMENSNLIFNTTLNLPSGSKINYG